MALHVEEVAVLDEAVHAGKLRLDPGLAAQRVLRDHVAPLAYAVHDGPVDQSEYGPGGFPAGEHGVARRAAAGQVEP